MTIFSVKLNACYYLEDSESRFGCEISPTTLKDIAVGYAYRHLAIDEARLIIFREAFAGTYTSSVLVHKQENDIRCEWVDSYMTKVLLQTTGIEGVSE